MLPCQRGGFGDMRSWEGTQAGTDPKWPKGLSIAYDAMWNHKMGELGNLLLGDCLGIAW